MRRRPRRGVPGGRGALLVATAVLVGAVVAVRPSTATLPPGAADDPPRRAGVTTAAAPLLGRDGTPTARLGDSAADLRAAGWQGGRARPGQAGGCRELVLPAALAGAPRLSAWTLADRVVVVRLDAPDSPGLLLPTAVRTGWAVEAVSGAAGGGLVATTVAGADGPQTVLVGDLPVDAWPPAPQRGTRTEVGGVVAAEPPPPVVELVLGDGGTGAVVSAEVRTPAGRRCTSGPGRG